MKFKSIGDYPESGSFIGKFVEVCFNYDTTKTYQGQIVRDDITFPFLLIIKLENGKFMLSTECQYRII